MKIDITGVGHSCYFGDRIWKNYSSQKGLHTYSHIRVESVTDLQTMTAQGNLVFQMQMEAGIWFLFIN